VIHEEQGVAMEEDGGHTLISKRPNLVLQYIEHDKPEVLFLLHPASYILSSSGATLLLQFLLLFSFFFV
jgi:hypothetical protein